MCFPVRKIFVRNIFVERNHKDNIYSIQLKEKTSYIKLIVKIPVKLLNQDSLNIRTKIAHLLRITKENKLQQSCEKIHA